MSRLYEVVKDPIPKDVVLKGNKAGSWEYGYNPKYDVIVISM